MRKRIDKMAKQVEDQGQARNRIGGGTSIVGEIVSKGDFRIDGSLEGKITTEGKVVVGPNGHVKGEIKCTNADVSGKVEATVYVSQLLSLQASAKLHGDIIANKLSIEPGAEFTGSCKMGPVIKDIKNAEKAGQEASTEKRTAEQRS